MSYDAWKLTNPIDEYDEDEQERRDRLEDEAERRLQAQRDAD